MNINSGIKQAVILTIGIMAVVLFLPFLVSCSQNRKAPAVSPQPTVGKLRRMKLPRCNISPHLISEKDYGLRGSSG